MSEISKIRGLYGEALQVVEAYKAINKTASYVLPEDIVKIVKRHGTIAVVSAFIPVGGLDVVAATANIWTMYVRINNKLGISFSDNKMKSIGSAVVSNLIQNLGVMAVAEGLKWTGVGYFASVAILTGSLYALTITAGWVYLKALSNMALHDDNIEESVKAALKETADIKKVYDDNKKK
ncbi:MAG: hypothetical protein IJ618_10555 [Prevotella sp.]|nr:hypothetical protein [Prevotella sp.]